MHVSADHIIEALLVLVPLGGTLFVGIWWVLRKVVPTREEFSRLSAGVLTMNAAQEGINKIMGNHIEHLNKSVDKLSEVIEDLRKELHLRKAPRRR